MPAVGDRVVLRWGPITRYVIGQGGAPGATGAGGIGGAQELAARSEGA